MQPTEISDRALSIDRPTELALDRGRADHATTEVDVIETTERSTP
jgi:hypothetical protein